MTFGSVNALNFERKGDVVDHRAVRQERKILKHHTHLMAPNIDHLLARGRQQVLSLVCDLATRWLYEAGEAAYERRFSRTRQSHNDDNFAGIDIECNFANGANIAAVGYIRLFWLIIVSGKNLSGSEP